MTSAPLGLADFFSTDAVGVVGASPRAGNIGAAIVRTLTERDWDGVVVAVNRGATQLPGVPTYASVAEIAEPVDVGVVVVPAEHVLGVVDELLAASITKIVVISSGFSEVHEGVAIEAELARRGRAAGATIVGPNCEGLADYHRNFVCSFGPTLGHAEAGNVSVVSQSGGLTGIIARRLGARGIGLAQLVSTGNECDLTALDAIEAVADAPQTEVIAVYAEEIRDRARAFDVLRDVAAAKPLVVMQAGTSAPGRRAAASHTGAIAGEAQLTAAILDQAGAIRVDHTTALVDAVTGLAGRSRAVHGNRVAILSQSGGMSVEAADQCYAHGLTVPVLDEEARAGLRSIIPYYGTVENPVDLTAAVLSRQALLAECVAVAAAAPDIDVVLLLLTALPEPEELVAFAERWAASATPVLLTWLGETTPGSATARALAESGRRGLAVFETVEGACRAACALARWGGRNAINGYPGEEELDAAGLGFAAA